MNRRDQQTVNGGTSDMADEKKDTATKTPRTDKPAKKSDEKRPKEIGGRKEGPDPTRYGDWEKNGRAIDF